MTDKIFVVMVGLLLLVVVTAAAFMAYGALKTPEPSFSYDRFEGNTAVCVGDNLEGIVYGHTQGRANITEIIHTVYFADTSQIARRLPQIEPVTAPTFEAQDFSFPLLVDVSDMKAGRYTYVRTAWQRLGGSSSEFAQIAIDFEVVECQQKSHAG